MARKISNKERKMIRKCGQATTNKHHDKKHKPSHHNRKHHSFDEFDEFDTDDTIAVQVKIVGGASERGAAFIITTRDIIHPVHEDFHEDWEFDYWEFDY